MKYFQVLLVLVIFFASSVVGASDYEKEYKKQTELGLRLFGSYSFSDKDNQDFFGADVKPVAIDVILPTNNPNLSWRISLDGLTASGWDAVTTYIDSQNYGYLAFSSDLTIGGFSGAVISHSDKKESVRLYGGGGLGLYSAEEKITMSGYLVVSGFRTPLYLSDTAEGSAIGLNLFGGVNFALSQSVSLGIEYNIKKLNVNMESSLIESTNVNYGGQCIFIAFNIGL